MTWANGGPPSGILQVTWQMEKGMWLAGHELPGTPEPIQISLAYSWNSMGWGGTILPCGVW